MKRILLLLSFIISFTSFAQWSNNPALNIPLSDTLASTVDALSPKVISDGNGGAIIVWSQSQIHGQRISSTGYKLWSQMPTVIVGSIGDPTVLSYLINPVIVSDDSGGAIVAWAEYNAGRTISVSRVKPDGSSAWQRRVCLTTGRRSNPSIASDGGGGAIITWEDQRNGANNSDIYAQRMTANGDAQWDSNGVAICTAVQNQTVPRIASDGMGGAFIAWSDNRFASTRIYAQHMNSIGQSQWGTTGMLICAPTNDPAANPRIAATATGEAIITWSYGAGGTWDVYAQKVNSDTVVWATNGVPICNEIRTQWKPEIVADGIGGAIISWQDSRRISFDEEDVYAQDVGSNGAMRWAQNGIPICTQLGNSNVPHSIAADEEGGAIVAWEDHRNGNTDLYAQRVNAGGGVQWTFNGVAISTAPGTQGAPTVAIVANRGAVFAWHDFRRVQYSDIFGQGVDSTGTLGATTSVQDETQPTNFGLEQNYPNPFNPATKIEFQVPTSEFVSLKVFNLLGQEIAPLVNEKLNAGSHQVQFNGKGLASGVYFYRLTSGGLSLSRKLLLTK